MHNDRRVCKCGHKHFDEGGFGLDFCLSCGLGTQGYVFNAQYVYQDRIPGQQSYTRLKRFKKYLCRAMRQQSGCTIPRDTWDYLNERGPYRDSKHIQYVLKQARNIRRKCYDSLPFLTAALCPHLSVPTLSLREKNRAIEHFKQIDFAFSEGPFVSYLFCLEYILMKLGRADICDYINRIQCVKRRKAYKIRLDGIFENACETDIMSQMRARGRTPCLQPQ
jgi:hypothetical protein